MKMTRPSNFGACELVIYGITFHVPDDDLNDDDGHYWVMIPLCIWYRMISEQEKNQIEK